MNFIFSRRNVEGILILIPISNANFNYNSEYNDVAV
jgi:hypothetical protein